MTKFQKFHPSHLSLKLVLGKHFECHSGQGNCLILTESRRNVREFTWRILYRPCSTICDQGSYDLESLGERYQSLGGSGKSARVRESRNFL